MSHTDEVTTDAFLDGRARQLRNRLRATLAASVAPGVEHRDRTGEFAGPAYQALAREGLAGVLFPAELGGTGHGTVGYAMAVEEITAVCPATSLIYMTQTHAAYPILVAGTPAQQAAYIPDLCAGTAYGSLAVTEPDAGSDVSALRTTAKPDGDGYLIDGAKTFITNGDVADVIVLFATVDPAAGRAGVTAFLVPGDAEGLSRGRPFEKMGMHGSSTVELFLDRVRVPATARLGPEGGGWPVTMRSVTKSRISAAAQGVGIATAAYAAVAGRFRAAGPIPPELGFRLAGLRSRVLAGRALLYATAAAVDRDERDSVAAVSAAKLFCTDLGVQVADEACALLGADGDRADLGVERLLRDAKVTQIYDGTNEIQRLIIARDTAGRLT
ncbi:acyl-CoA dehydrogenase family protein [Solwaraspora sp. WMMD1047]|uniref:acyl-CoA dehydrogenase family protein n=1 Tax=Solwaraspora sp. WMMD1047 TaxID=3016102 RepID=UPI0024175434|nr:acyl-CoA dehydrogenase family protein [Solwaraspora sp. WMMD1047]MDG4834317.1 acyl-CoA dehydrogenase family protein [Solwaraspora sp. WMMD1047]